MGWLPRPDVLYRTLTVCGFLFCSQFSHGYVLIKVDVLNATIKETKNEIKSQLEKWQRENILQDRVLIGEISAIEQNTTISAQTASTDEIVAAHDLIQKHEAALAVTPTTHACRMYSTTRAQGDARNSADNETLLSEDSEMRTYVASVASGEDEGASGHDVKLNRKAERAKAFRADLVRLADGDNAPGYFRFLSPSYDETDIALASARRRVLIGDAGEQLFKLDNRAGPNVIADNLPILEAQAKASLVESTLKDLQRSRLSLTGRQLSREQFSELMGFPEGHDHVNALFDSLRGDNDHLIESQALSDWIAATAPLMQFAYAPEDASRPMAESQKNLFTDVQEALRETHELRQELRHLAIKAEGILSELSH